MKKLIKYVSLFILCLSLTGCMKYNISITVNDDMTMDASMVFKVQDSFLEAMEMTSEDFFESMEEDYLSDDDLSTATITQSTETIDEEQWSCITISGLTSTQVSTVISQEEVDGKDSLVLTIPTSDLVSEEDDISAYGYTVSQLKALGMEMTMDITMPNTLTSNVGEVNGNTVTIDLLELMYSDSVPENIIISSPIISDSNMTMIIVGVVAVIVVAGCVIVFMNKKKKDSNDDSQVEDIENNQSE